MGSEMCIRDRFEGLGNGALPSLENLDLEANIIGDAGASALGAALNRGALPCLEVLVLAGTDLGNAGLIALAPGLRSRPHLRILNLGVNRVGDDGVAALVAPGEEVLPSLVDLHLEGNDVDDAGCATLVAALSSGAMPSAEWIGLGSEQVPDISGLGLEQTPTRAARAAVDEALASRWQALEEPLENEEPGE